MNAQADALTSELVVDYLRTHPTFFNHHLDLLEELMIPHPSGAAISLIAKQLELLRNRNQEMETELTSLIEIAKNNDAAFNRIHQLTLALIEAPTLAEAVHRLETELLNHFTTDFVRVRIIADYASEDPHTLFIAPGSPDLEPFVSLLTSDQLKYGRPTLAQAKLLFGENALDVQSAVLIPLKLAGNRGILAIASRNADRFHYSMGSVFLNHISEIVSARLQSLLSENRYG